MPQSRAHQQWRPIFPVPASAGTPNFDNFSELACGMPVEIFDVQARLMGYVGVYVGAKRWDDAYVPVQYGINGAGGPEWAARTWSDESEFTREAYAYLKRQLRGEVDSLTDLVAADYPPPKWFIPDLIPEGVTILAGPKGRGKSFIVFGCAIASAGGYDALGNIPCKAGPVLYLSLEDNKRRIKARALAILQGRPAPKNLTVKVEWPNADDGGLEMIREWIDDHPGAQGVIVDVLARIKGRPDRDRGVYDQDYATIVAFKRIALETGVPIVLVHHTNKAGNKTDPVLAVSGTMGLTGAADTVLVLEREANDPHGILYVRGRDVPEGEIALEFDKDTGCATRLGPADDFRKSEERRAVVRFLLDCPSGATPAEVADAIGKGRAKSSVRTLLFKMHKAGQIYKFQDGRYGAPTGA